MYLGKAFPKFCLVITKQFLIIQPWGKNHWPFNLDTIMLPLAHTTIDTILFFNKQIEIFQLELDFSNTIFIYKHLGF